MAMIFSVIASVVALVWVVLTIRIVGGQPGYPNIGSRLVNTALSAGLVAIAVLLSSGNLQSSIANGYPGDSLYELSDPQISIVVLVSIAGGVLAVGMALALARQLSRSDSWLGSSIRLIANLVMISAIFWFGYALSPQIFYAYYRTIFADLPLHYVGRDLSDLTPFWEALTIIGNGHLNDHGAALIIWMMITVTIAIHIGRLAEAHLHGRTKLAFFLAAAAAIVAAIP